MLNVVALAGPVISNIESDAPIIIDEVNIAFVEIMFVMNVPVENAFALIILVFVVAFTVKFVVERVDITPI